MGLEHFHASLRPAAFVVLKHSEFWWIVFGVAGLSNADWVTYNNVDDYVSLTNYSLESCNPSQKYNVL